MINLSQEIAFSIIEEIVKVVPYLEEDIRQQGRLKNYIESLLNDYEITSRRTDLTTSDILEKAYIFLACKKLEGASKHTIYNYTLTFKKMNNYFYKPVSMITTNDLRLFIAQEYKDCQPNSQNTQISRMKAFFTWLQDEGYIASNPTKSLKEIKVPKRKRGHIKAIDIEKMREQCKNIRDKCLVEFLLATGCRVGECSDALISNIDWDNNSILVIGKGNKERTVYFNVKCRYYLIKYIEERQDKEIFIDSLFITERKPYRQLGIRAIQRDIKRISVDAGITYSVYPHLYRHSYCQRLVDSKVPINITQKLLGHSSSDTTSIYYDISDNDLKQEYRKVAI